MDGKVERRQFLQVAASAPLVYFGVHSVLSAGVAHGASPIISPGCRGSKVRVAKIYLGVPKAPWPTPKMDLDEEVKRYEAEFAKRSKEFADVDFTVSELVSTADQAKKVKERLGDVEGILAIHLSMGISGMLGEALVDGQTDDAVCRPVFGTRVVGFR